MMTGTSRFTMAAALALAVTMLANASPAHAAADTPTTVMTTPTVAGAFDFEAPGYKPMTRTAPIAEPSLTIVDFVIPRTARMNTVAIVAIRPETWRGTWSALAPSTYTHSGSAEQRPSLRERDQRDATGSAALKRYRR